MIRQKSECCPQCGCEDVSKTKNRGLIEIGPLTFEDQEESIPVDIWACSKCQRRFVMLDTDDEQDKAKT